MSSRPLLPVTTTTSDDPPARQHSCAIALWITVGFTIFSVTWASFNGGYISSLPLFLLLAGYCYSSASWSGDNLCTHVIRTIKSNFVHILSDEKRNFTLIMLYWLFRLSLLVWYPQGEGSNGSPYSLIFFTCLFLFLYILPPVLFALCIALTKCLPGSCSKWRCFNSDCHGGFCTRKMVLGGIKKWKKSLLVITVLVILMYVIDGDITYVLTHLGKGKSCWPLLVTDRVHDTLPYPLQHAWTKEWQDLFSGYRPSKFVKLIIIMGREMEVIHTLPMLIGLFILSKIFLPQQSYYVKLTLFGCIAGIVLSGVTSGSLKLLFHRYRPNAYGNPYMWTGPGSAVVNHLKFSKLDLSFPAGHTTVTCSVATCLHQALSRQLPHRPNWLRFWYTILLYFYPLVVLFSRVSDCYHWTSDTVFGIFLGYVLGHIIMATLHRRVERSKIPPDHKHTHAAALNPTTHSV